MDCQTRLEDFINKVDFLYNLEADFTQSEIDGIIKSLPSDKSPGPDGFSNEFLRKCWPIIIQDFYKLCNEFQHGTVYLKSINKSYITLIPKIDGAQHPSEFRPISLLNSSVKLITKLLANKVQTHIIRLVHKNQYWKG